MVCKRFCLCKENKLEHIDTKLKSIRTAISRNPSCDVVSGFDHSLCP